MFWVPIFSIIHSNGLFFTVYTYFFTVLLFLELILLMILNHNVSKLMREINKKNKQIKLIGELTSDYEKLLERQRDLVNTNIYIDNYFLEKDKDKVLVYKFLEKSELIYLFAGLLGGFLVVLLSILAMDFEGIEGFQNLYLYLGDVLLSLKPALFYFFSGIIFAIISKIIFILFGLKERINIIKIHLVNYLENNIKYKFNRELKEIELFQELIKTLNNGFIRMEGVIEDTITDQIIELNEKMDKYLSCSRGEEPRVLKDVAITEEEDD